MGILDGKVAIITGAGGGLGRAYALLFAAEGAKVVVNDLGGAMDGGGGGNAMADQVVAEIAEAGGTAVANYASVSDPDGAQSMVDDAVNHFGGLDILINNAGILRDKTLLKLPIDHFDLVIAVHARGSFLCGKAAAAKMRELGGGGTIVNTSSIAGLKGNFGQTNYACAKAGIAGMTRVWGMELGRHGIRCNAIAPMAKTRMTEDISAVPDDITPEQIAPMVLYLASDMSEAVNGRIFGCHGPHLFEYHMVLSPGVNLDTPLWTADLIHERLDEISALPEPEGPASAAGDGERSISEVCNEVFETMATVFVAEKAGDWESVIHFEITGTGSWGVTVKDGGCSSSKGQPDGTKCTITYDSADTLLATVSGKMNPQQAFMGGKIKADNMGDLMKFATCFDMKKAAAIARERAAAGEPKKRSIHDQVDEVFTRMPAAFVPEKAAGWAATMHFEISGTGSYTITVADGTCDSSKGAPDDATCTITYDTAQTLLDTMTGKANPQQAFMAGRIKADNMGDLMKFAQCFDRKKAGELAKAEAAADDAPKAEGMNRAVIGRTYRTGAEFVYREHTEAYAQATNDANDAYVGTNGVVAPPIFPVRALMPVVGEAVMDRELNADLMRLVHGEQDMIFHSTLQPWDLVAARATVEEIETKASGELLKVRQRLLRDGETVCEVISGYFVRAKRKPDEPKPEKKADEAEAEEREILFESTYTVDSDQTYRYADASLDKNPIHVDENAAKAAGHPSVINHGLCTMAMTCREVVNELCAGDPTRLQRLKVRFTKIVLPNDELTTRSWPVEDNGDYVTVGVETTNQKGEIVIGNAIAEIRAI